MIILEVLLGIVTIVLYIILRAQLLNETRTIYKAGYLAVMKDIRDPDLDLGDKESNWSIVYNSIVTSINEK